ncbi:MAG: hypothetical protein EZS28_003750 [Streblomastix strix]|uniref:Uncharacterized protein n=1 Tax=Streblomastix strix TaxID=222440 RepID=A0A5J4X0R7_9EUKA|nr:MAG: hypothetical protein EZS28_003750 [Streblomastix strix]
MDDLEEIMVRCNLQGLNWDKLRILYPNLRNAIFPKFEIQPSNQTNFFFVKLDSQNAQFLLQKRVDSFTIPPYNEYRAIAFKEGRRNTSAVIYGPKCIETDINDLQNGNVEVHESYEFDDDGKQMILYAVKYRTREAGEISWDIIQGNIGQLRNKNILGCNENEDKYDPYKIFIRNIMSDSIKLRIQFLWIDSEILCNEIWFKFDLRQLRNKGTIFNEIFNEITIIDDLKRIGRESGIPNYNQNRDLALLAECEVLKRVVRVQLQFDSYGNLFNSGVITLENTLLAEVYVTKE